jgi:hypothetical protein
MYISKTDMEKKNDIHKKPPLPTGRQVSAA